MAEVSSTDSAAPRAMDMPSLGPTVLAVVILFGLLFGGGFSAESVGYAVGKAASAFILALPIYALVRFGTARGRVMSATRRLNVFCLLICAVWLAVSAIMIAQWSARRQTVAPAQPLVAGAAPLQQRDRPAVGPPAKSTQPENLARTPAEEDALRELARLHPDWEQVDADPAFAAFIGSLPPDRRAALVAASQNYNHLVVASEIAAFKQERMHPTGRSAAPPTR